MQYSERFFYLYQKGYPVQLETHQEIRLYHLFELLEKNIYPWQWDYENYPLGKDDPMYGVFYKQDIENIKLIQKLITARQQEQQEKARKEQEAQQTKVRRH